VSGWLLSIVGITVVGVLIELLLTDSPMSKFVRSIYAFFILLVIVAPIPSILRNGVELSLDQGLVTSINAQTIDARLQSATRALEMAGFNDVVLTHFNNKIYVNAYNSTKKDSRPNHINCYGVHGSRALRRGGVCMKQVFPREGGLT
jgi:hypothetical protein